MEEAVTSKYLLVMNPDHQARSFFTPPPQGVVITDALTTDEAIKVASLTAPQCIILGPTKEGSNVIRDLEKIRKANPCQPVIIYLHDNSPRKIREGFLRGAADCLNADVLNGLTREEIYDNIRQVLYSEEPKARHGQQQCIIHQQQLVKAFEASMDGMAILNNKEKYTYLNQAHASLYGYDNPCDLTGKTWRMLYETAELKRFETEIFPKLNARGHWRGEAVGKRKDGSTFPQELSLAAFGDGGLVCIVRDVTKTKKINEELIQQRDTARTYFQAVGIMMLVLSPQGKILRINQKGANMLGFDLPDEVTGMNWFDNFIPEEQRQMNREIFHQVMTGEQNIALQHESSVLTRHGKLRLIQWSNSLICDENGRPTATISSGQDVTRRRQMEQELVEKNRELNDFVYMVSHDLKNPLNIIKGFLNAIRDNPDLFQKYYKRIINQANILSDFINNLLKLSRAGKVIGEKVQINLETLLSQIFCVTREEGDDAVLQVKSPLPKVTGDRARITQVFTNLISNSLQYRDPKKKPLVINVSHISNHDGVTFVITDNGLGIDQENLKNIFDAGYTLKKSKGTGFGLPIASKIVEAHGGRTWAESDGAGKGSSFFVSLPVSQAPSLGF